MLTSISTVIYPETLISKNHCSWILDIFQSSSRGPIASLDGASIQLCQFSIKAKREHEYSTVAVLLLTFLYEWMARPMRSSMYCNDLVTNCRLQCDYSGTYRCDAFMWKFVTIPWLPASWKKSSEWIQIVGHSRPERAQHVLDLQSAPNGNGQYPFRSRLCKCIKGRQVRVEGGITGKCPGQWCQRAEMPCFCFTALVTFTRCKRGVQKYNWSCVRLPLNGTEAFSILRTIEN